MPSYLEKWNTVTSTTVVLVFSLLDSTISYIYFRLFRRIALSYFTHCGVPTVIFIVFDFYVYCHCNSVLLHREYIINRFWFSCLNSYNSHIAVIRGKSKKGTQNTTTKKIERIIGTRFPPLNKIPFYSHDLKPKGKFIVFLSLSLSHWKFERMAVTQIWVAIYQNVMNKISTDKLPDLLDDHWIWKMDFGTGIQRMEWNPFRRELNEVNAIRRKEKRRKKKTHQILL